MNIYFSEKFEKKLLEIERTNPKLNRKIKKTIKLFSVDPSYPSLRLHKIQISHNYSISVDMSMRIIVHWRKNDALFLNIGSHNEVY